MKRRQEEGRQACRRPASKSALGSSDAPALSRRSSLLGGMLFEQLAKLLGHRAAQLFGIDDRDGAAIVARHVMADADRNQLNRRRAPDLLHARREVTHDVIAR